MVGRFYHTHLTSGFFTLTPELKESLVGELDFVAFPFMPKAYVPRLGVAAIARGICW